jgi:hypothetical protein
MVALRELKALEEAKREHQSFIAATTKMAALLAAEGASLSRAQMDALARISSRSSHVSSDHDAESCERLRSVAGARNVGAGA